MLAPLALAATFLAQDVPTVLVERDRPLPGLPANTVLVSELGFRSTSRAGFVMGAFYRDGAGNNLASPWGNPVDGPLGPLLWAPTGPASVGFAPGFQNFGLADGEMVWGPFAPATIPCQNSAAMFRGADPILCLENPSIYPGGIVAEELLDARSRDDGSLLAAIRFGEPYLAGRPTFTEIRRGPLLSRELGRGQGINGVGPIVNVERARLEPRGRSYGAIALVDAQGATRRIPVVNGVAPRFPATGPVGDYVEAGNPVEPGTSNTEAWTQVDEAWWDPAGGWYVTGTTDGPAGSQRVIVRNHRVVMRQGDVVDGRTLGDFLGVSVAPRGELITMWDVAPGAALRLALLVEDRVVLEEGEMVDADGDGTVDPGHTIIGLYSDFPFGGSLARYNDLDEDRVLRCLAFMERPGSSNGFAILQLQLPLGDGVCAGELNSTGGSALLGGTGSTCTTAGGLTLTVDGLPPSALGLVAVSRDSGLTTGLGGGQGTLCLGGSIGRLFGPGGTAFVAHASGHLDVPVDLGALAQPGGTTAIQPGETWLFQFWYRDVTAQGTATSNLSGAVAFEFR